MERWLRCAEARAIDLVAYLSDLGFMPQKISGSDYWYLSPFREEQTPSFKVDRSRNLWYDHGSGSGGTLIDFGLLFHRCSVQELLERLSAKNSLHFSFHPPVLPAQEQQEKAAHKVQVLRVELLTDERLLRYVSERQIDSQLAQKYFQQVHFKVGEKTFVALGFPNRSGGFELRNRYFKGCSAPKDFTLIEGTSNAPSLAVFEGCFSFLSYLQLAKKAEGKTAANSLFEEAGIASNFLVLNSLSLLEKSRAVMERHALIHLHLDRDAAGRKATEKVLQWSPKYKDKSALYLGHKDLNDYLWQQQSPKQSLQLKQGQGRGRHL